MNEAQILEENELNWKTKYLVGGAVVGALVGIVTGYLLTRAAEEAHGGPPEIGTGDVLKATLGIVGAVRGIASLGSEKL